MVTTLTWQVRDWQMPDGLWPSEEQLEAATFRFHRSEYIRFNLKMIISRQRTWTIPRSDSTCQNILDWTAIHSIGPSNWIDH